MYTARSRPVVLPSSALKYSAAWHKIFLITCLHLHYILEEEGMRSKIVSDQTDVSSSSGITPSSNYFLLYNYYFYSTISHSSRNYEVKKDNLSGSHLIILQF